MSGYNYEVLTTIEKQAIYNSQLKRVEREIYELEAELEGDVLDPSLVSERRSRLEGLIDKANALKNWTGRPDPDASS